MMRPYFEVTYRIADVRLCLETPWKQEVSVAFLPFVEKEQLCDWKIRFCPVEEIEKPLTKRKFENHLFCDYQESSEIFVRQFHNDREGNVPYAQTRLDASEKRVEVTYLPEFEKRFGTGIRDFFYMMLERIFVEENVLALHAACVNTPLGGILFSGISGAGKSTQADLWCQYGQGELINGDRVLLRKSTDGWYAFGSPYAGSSGCHRQKNCKIRAIVFPIQSELCEGQKLKGVEKFGKVFANVTLNNWDAKFVSKASDMINELVKEIDVYQMKCTKNQKAVLALTRLLKGECED